MVFHHRQLSNLFGQLSTYLTFLYQNLSYMIAHGSHFHLEIFCNSLLCGPHRFTVEEELHTKIPLWV